MTFDDLRKKHPKFIYQGFEIKSVGGDLSIYFNFEVSDDIKFRPEINFPNVSKDRLKQIDPKVLNNLVFNLGMVELLSYWKATCSPKIIIKAGFLDREQINFWKKLLIKGLGEFFYNNKIDFTQKDLVEFVVDSEKKEGPVFGGQLKDRDLILVGGGKDSAVTLDMVSKSNRESKSLMLNPTKAAEDIVRAAHSVNPIIIKRTIDPKLLMLNEQGYLNGHTPFSAYLAFFSTLAGVLYDYKNLIVSNEASSDEENIQWLDQKINHQYSKAAEFEKDFQKYSQKYLANTNYFSSIRDLGDLEISELFSKMEKYHKFFRSCNKGSKKGLWCGKCPKCVSTYLTLYPFLGNKTEEIFGKNLLEDESLIPLVKGLLRENDILKPFECVATVEEIKKAISLGIEKAKKEGIEIPKVLKEFAR